MVKMEERVGESEGNIAGRDYDLECCWVERHCRDSVVPR